MPSFRYEPYYEYSGPTRADPFRELLSDEGVQRNREWFFAHIDGCFAGTDAVVAIADGIVSIETNMPEADCDDIVKRHLNAFDLFARKIRA